MRTTRDRIRHTLCFEIIGLVLITPLGMWVYGLPATDMGVVALGSSLIATGWNYLYNLIFDHIMQHFKGHTYKSVPLRIIHAFLFEGGLLIVLMPLIAWYLHISLWDALTMDIGIAVFYMLYAFVYNWAYDRVFPIPA